MAKTSNLHIRINPKIRQEAESILNATGLTLSSGIDIFFRNIIENGGIPFEIKQSRGSRWNSYQEFRNYADNR